MERLCCATCSTNRHICHHSKSRSGTQRKNTNSLTIARMRLIEPWVWNPVLWQCSCLIAALKTTCLILSIRRDIHPSVMRLLWGCALQTLFYSSLTVWKVLLSMLNDSQRKLCDSIYRSSWWSINLIGLYLNLNCRQQTPISKSSTLLTSSTCSCKHVKVSIKASSLIWVH